MDENNDKKEIVENISLNSGTISKMKVTSYV
jgi:hypothetical protein